MSVKTRSEGQKMLRLKQKYQLERSAQLAQSVKLVKPTKARSSRQDFRQRLKQHDEDYFGFLREQIRTARKELHLTQAQLGKAINKSGVVISDLERGRTEVNAAELMRLAHVLEKPIKYFFPIRDVPSEEELTTEEWELVIQYRKLDNHPDLQKLLMDEAKKLGELAQVKEGQMGMMLLEDMVKEKESGRSKNPAEAEEIRKMLKQARRSKAKK
jgi:transcriptional regulator with XRE-family HTH domain